MKQILACGALLTALFVPPAHAAVRGLINTGLDAEGNPLALGSVQPGWTITAVSPPNPPGGLTPPELPGNTFVVGEFPSWMRNDARLGGGSSWISYTYPLYEGGDQVREFDYTLRFAVERDDAFYMRMAADNSVGAFLDEFEQELLLQWGPFDPPSDVPYQSWSPWIPVTGLPPGEHTFHMIVGNLSQDFVNPSGLRVEFSNVPEPSVVVFWVSGLGLLGAMRLGRLFHRNQARTRALNSFSEGTTEP